MRVDRTHEVIRVVQEACKSAGLGVSGRILLRLVAGAELLEVIREYVGLITDKVLAVDLQQGDAKDLTVGEPELGFKVRVIKA